MILKSDDIETEMKQRRRTGKMRGGRDWDLEWILI